MPNASTYDELKEAIGRAYADMPRQLQRIARFAMQHPHELALGTVAAVAEANEVQPSSMIRFANALGYDGFSQMQQVFRDHLVERSESYRERIEQLRRSSRKGAARSPHGVLHDLIGESVTDLGRLEESLHDRDIGAGVTAIIGASQIYVLAQRRAFPVAAYLAYALSQLELRAHLLDGAGGMLRASLRAMARGDLLLVATFRNYSPEVVDAAEDCAKRGIAVLAITDSPLSPVAQFASVCFEIGDDTASAFRALVAPLCLAQALVMSAGHKLAETRESTTKLRKVRK